ncbi:ABC transporter ATP-binding protein [Rhodobium gokarnense]|uniref:ABC-type Fe3+/spermidine/putrescine transport system ATPase subunit n=1 Tax=Rhodobium gokarnense TaxID=364296 RepID=A0ABT3H697_9HYPH|nr:ABC transporter ATP-binding protein [Rhodobium gokarnense]MCW2305916.1 ABC-type Fe3+/spermidine/putrescine transport system ATPase subunit [Rhodobium gokarnense]
MSEPILELRGLHKRFGTAVPADDFSMDVDRGEFFTMLGPSGSGKSTILRMIAGLEYPDRGSIVINGRDMTRVPPWDRHLGMVFQNYAIFPHLDVGQNVAYGLRKTGTSKVNAKARVESLLALVGLEGFGERNVAQLSGGEQQRVAIARALAPNPSILLLDEPLSALDEKIRREMQDELRNIHQRTGTTFIYVTHDQEEALTMSDRVAVLNAGAYVQCDTPKEIFRYPRTPFVAHFFRGCNVLQAEYRRRDDKVFVALAGAEAEVDPRGRDLSSGCLAIRGETVHFGPPAATSDMALNATIEAITYRGLYSNYHLKLADGQTLEATLSQRSPMAVGDTVYISIHADNLVVLEPD